MKNVIILDEFDRFISKTSSAMARKLLKKKEATVISKDPFMLRLNKNQNSFGGNKMDSASIYKLFMGDEQPIYIQNVSGGRISFEFHYHGQLIPFRMANSREPKCINNEVPWEVMKNDVKFRGFISKPKLVKVMTQDEYTSYLDRRSNLLKTSKSELIKSAATKHNSTTMNDLAPPTKEELDRQLREEVKNPAALLNEVEEINTKILGVCQRLHPETDSAIEPLEALDIFESLEPTPEDLDYIRGHCYNDIIKKWALQKHIELTGGDSDIEVETLARSETIIREIDDQSQIPPVVRKKAAAKKPAKKRATTKRKKATKKKVA